MTKPNLFRWFLTIWIVVFSVVVIIGIHQNHVLAKKGAVALAVECSARDDLARRIHTAELFLKEHPHGIPGISAQTIEGDLNNKIAAFRAQRILDPYCKHGEVVTP